MTKNQKKLNKFRRCEKCRGITNDPIKIGGCFTCRNKKLSTARI